MATQGIGALQQEVQDVKDAGRNDDTMLVHITKNEFRKLAELGRPFGKGPTVNPKTGLFELGFLDDILKKLLPTIAGVAMNAFVPGSGMLGAAAAGALTNAAVNKKADLTTLGLGALGGYGGAGVGNALANAGSASSLVGTAGAEGAPASAAEINAMGLQGVPPAGADKLSLMGKGVGSLDSMNAVKGFAGANWKELAAAGAPLLQGNDSSGIPKAGGSSDLGYRWEVTRNSDGSYVWKKVPTIAAGGIISGGIGYKGGGGLAQGPGDGMSDSIPAAIDGVQPARLARDEFVLPADVVSGFGNGSSKAGAAVLYAMMDRVRKARTGTTKQGKRINPAKFLPA